VATAALPLSLTGGLLTGLIGGLTFGLGALLGMLAVLGLAARYIAMMLTTIQGPDGRRNRDDDAATVYGRAGEPFGSLIISSAALAAVAMPFVVLGPRPGLEILHPLALVLLGGLVSSLVVAMFLLPSAYLHLVPPQADETPPPPEEEPEAVTVSPGKAF
jgi:Cu/Ag efflux pump CusA